MARRSRSVSRWLALAAAGCVLAAGGCSRPKSKGPLGAADVRELADRYKQAHRAKDVESLRAIYLQLRFGLDGPWGERMVGAAETLMPTLFELELDDVEVVNVPGGADGCSLDYGSEREPSRANGFSAVGFHSAAYTELYKLLLLGRRAAEPGGPLMEVDPCLGVSRAQDGRLYLCASGPILHAVTDWVETGALPPVYRPPGHKFRFDPDNWPERVPNDWVRVARPRPGPPARQPPGAAAPHLPAVRPPA